MTIRIPLTPILCELFPEAQGEQEGLLAAMRSYYTVRGVAPDVRVEGDEVVLTVDAERIIGREKLFREALHLCEKGRFPEGREKLLALVAEDPTHSEYHRMLGQVNWGCDRRCSKLITEVFFEPVHRHGQLADLLVQFSLLPLVGLGVRCGAFTEHLLGSVEELLPPGGDLCGGQLVTLAQIAQSLALLERFQHYPGLERGGVFPVVLLRGHGLARF